MRILTRDGQVDTGLCAAQQRALASGGRGQRIPRPATAAGPAAGDAGRRVVPGVPQHAWRPDDSRRSGLSKAESSAMTLLERDHYLDRVPGGYLNLTHGYPEGLNPPWLRDYQLHPSRNWITGPDLARYTQELRANPWPDWPDIPPATFTEVICGWFEVFFQGPVAALAPPARWRSRSPRRR